MAFGGSFWSFLNFTQNSQLDNLLNDPNTTLEQVLNDDNILTEIRTLNPRLLDYCTDERIKQMMSYIIEEPTEEADKDRGYKFPFISCEILTADVETFLEAFFGRNPNHTRKHSLDSDYSSKAEGDSSEERSVEVEKEEKTEKEDKEEKEEKQEKKEDESKEEGEKEEKAEQEKKEEVETEKKTEATEQTETKEENKDQEETVKKDPFDIAKYFFSFLENESLNDTLVGYFSRFLNHLINRKTGELATFVWQHPEIVDKFIKHLSHRNIAEGLAKIFTSSLEKPPADEFTDLKLEKLQVLVNLFEVETSKLDNETIANSAYVISEVILKKNTFSNRERFESYFASNKFLDVIFKNLFRHKILTTHLSFVLNTLLSKLLQQDNASNSFAEEEHDTSHEAQEKPVEKQDQTYLHESLIKSADDIIAHLTNRDDPERETPAGDRIVPLGVAGLRLTELILYVIKLNVEKVSLVFAEKGIYQALMGLMVKYEWNNLLHSIIEKVFMSTLENECHTLRDKLLKDADFLGFLADSTKETDYTLPNSQQRKTRKGYLGHLTKIAKLLERLSDVDKEIKAYLDNEKWTQFKQTYLDVTLEKDNADLAKSAQSGSRRRGSEDEYMDENKNYAENIEDIIKKREDAFASFGHEHRAEPGEMDDDINDRDYDGKEQHDFANQDIFDKFDSTFDVWNKNDFNGDRPAEKAIDIWSFESINPNDFASTFKFTGFEIPKEEENKYLELNRKLEIIDIGPQHDPKLEQAYLENNFWARPKNTTHHIDDIMKEFEGHN